MTPEIKARIDADLANVSTMDFRDLLGLLAAYSARFDEEIRNGEVTRGAIRAYADQVLQAQIAQRGLRKVTKFTTCQRHRHLRPRCRSGPGAGPASAPTPSFPGPGCRTGLCQLFPGLDLFDPDACNAEYSLSWAYPLTEENDL